MLLTLLLLSSAFADDLLVFDYDDYPDEDGLDGTDGWESGYAADDWEGYRSSSSGRHYAMPQSDDNGGSFGGSSDATDNTLTNEDISVLEGWALASIFTEDDDTLGLVWGWQDSRNYYMLHMTGTGSSSGSSPIEGGVWTGIVRIRDGVAEILAETNRSYSRDTLQDVAIGFSDGEVWVKVWSDFGSSSSSTPYISLTATDPSPITAPGRAGFYAYDAGAADREYSYFGPITVYAYDDDGDGVPNDEDTGSGDGGAGDGGAGDGGAGDGGAGDGGAGDGGAGDGGAGDGGAGDGGTPDGGGDGGGVGDTGDGGLAFDGDVELTSCEGCSAGGAGFGLFALAPALLAAFRRRRS